MEWNILFTNNARTHLQDVPNYIGREMEHFIFNNSARTHLQGVPNFAGVSRGRAKNELWGRDCLFISAMNIKQNK